MSSLFVPCRITSAPAPSVPRSLNPCPPKAPHRPCPMAAPPDPFGFGDGTPDVSCIGARKRPPGVRPGRCAGRNLGAARKGAGAPGAGDRAGRAFSRAWRG
jgi:hypothetical protein